MGLFDKLKSKLGEQAAETVTFPAVLGAACDGKYVAMKDIPDEVFSMGVLGACCGIEPKEGKVYAPIGGKIVQVADTLHAIGIECGGMEILLHVGIDTVEMNGEGFQVQVREGQTVKKGDLLLTMDLEKIHAAGHPDMVIMAVTNSEDFSSVESVAVDTIRQGDDLLKITK